jgi:hypothetical protein
MRSMLVRPYAHRVWTARREVEYVGTDEDGAAPTKSGMQGIQDTCV